MSTSKRPVQTAASLATETDAVAAQKPVLTKIIATIGPATSSPEVIERMIEAGVSVFRINFSHGELGDHLDRVTSIRRIAERLGRATAILGDLQGPKIRVGQLPENGVEVVTGENVIFQRHPADSDPSGDLIRLTSTYEALIDDVEIGERLLVNDGAVRMLIVDKTADHIECAVMHGGLITTGKGINLPESKVSAGALTNRDRENVLWAVEHDLDFLALSFVKNADEVRQLAEVIEQAKSRLGRSLLRMPIIAKIERPQALDNINDIIEAADALMVARGDLGVELDLARVPVIQKRLLEVTQDHGKPAIVATQMLESMTNAPTPTRAEASDVAGAILSGADAVMLSGETAVGEYPVLSVETMRRIAQQTEEYLGSLPPTPTPPRRLVESRHRTAALAHGVWAASQHVKARFIVVWSQAGGGARYLSQNNFQIPIIAVSTDDRALRQMQLLRGVTPVRMPLPESIGRFTEMADQYLLATGWAQEGECYILVAGTPLGRRGATNSLMIRTIKAIDPGFEWGGEPVE